MWEIEFTVRVDSTTPAEHEFTPFGIMKTIASLLTETNFVTVLSQRVNDNPALSPIGKPVPTIVP